MRKRNPGTGRTWPDSREGARQGLLSPVWVSLFHPDDEDSLKGQTPHL